MPLETFLGKRTSILPGRKSLLTEQTLVSEVLGFLLRQGRDIEGAGGLEGQRRDLSGSSGSPVTCQTRSRASPDSQCPPACLFPI